MNTKIILKLGILCLACALMASCYDDQDGNDFDSTMPNVLITIPESAYSGSLGQAITIEPVVSTTIDESDLEYIWEVKGARYNDQERQFFVPMVDDELQQRTLNYVCHLDSNITSLNYSYECRLRVHQKTTGRDFYSTSPFTLTIQGVTGLMVLYDCGNGSDIGVLEADEFMPEASSLPDEPKAVAGMYSMNAGRPLDGKGLSIVQIYPPDIEWFGDDMKNRCRIFVMTESQAFWLERNDLSIYGDWESEFYLQDSRKVNAGQPKGVVFQGDELYTFDGDNLFIRQPAYTPQFLFPMYTPETECVGGHTFVFSPGAAIELNPYGGMQDMLYASSVDGTSQKGFVALTQNPMYGGPDNTVLLDTQDDPVPFNPADMHADLLKMRYDSRGHVVAVMKGDGSHPVFGSNCFLADIFTDAETAGNSTYQGFPQCVCDMSLLTDIDRAIAFDFGSTQNMMYYATASNVYRYGLDDKTLSAAQTLCMTDGSSIIFDGEITMMKMLDSPNVERHDSDEILLVATYDGSQSRLYALHIEPMTGNVDFMSEYSADNVGGWEFGRIYDVNIKAM